MSGYEVVHIDELEALPVDDEGLTLRPIRRRFDLRSFGVNANTAERAGEVEAALEQPWKAVERDPAGVRRHAPIDPDLDSLREDPRFLAIAGEPEAGGAGT